VSRWGASCRRRPQDQRSGTREGPASVELRAARSRRGERAGGSRGCASRDPVTSPAGDARGPLGGRIVVVREAEAGEAPARTAADCRRLDAVGTRGRARARRRAPPAASNAEVFRRSSTAVALGCHHSPFPAAPPRCAGALAVQPTWPSTARHGDSPRRRAWTAQVLSRRPLRGSGQGVTIRRSTPARRPDTCRRPQGNRVAITRGRDGGAGRRLPESAGRLQFLAGFAARSRANRRRRAWREDC